MTKCEESIDGEHRWKVDYQSEGHAYSVVVCIHCGEVAYKDA